MRTNVLTPVCKRTYASALSSGPKAFRWPSDSTSVTFPRYFRSTIARPTLNVRDEASVESVTLVDMPRAKKIAIMLEKPPIAKAPSAGMNGIATRATAGVSNRVGAKDQIDG